MQEAKDVPPASSPMMTPALPASGLDASSAAPREELTVEHGNPELADEHQTSETIVHARAMSDPEIASLWRHASMNEGNGSAHTQSIRRIIKLEQQNAEQARRAAGPAGLLTTMSMPSRSSFELPDVALQTLTPEGKKDLTPLEYRAFTDPYAPPSNPSNSEANKYGAILNNTLVTLIEKHQVIVTKQKDLKASQKHFSLAQGEVLRVQQAVVKSQARVVQAHEDLIDGLAVQLDRMERLHGEVSSHVVSDLRVRISR